MTQEYVIIDRDLCTLCGLCLDVCPRSIIELGEESARIKDPGRCMQCGHCKSVCPEDAPQLNILDPAEFKPILPRDKMPDPDYLLDFFRSRRSIRFYKKDTVEKRDLERMVQAGRFTPSGGNRQPVQYVMIHTPEMINKIRETTHRFLAAEAQKTMDAVERNKKYGDPLPPRIEIRIGYAPLWSVMGKLYKRGRDLLFHHAPAVCVLHLDPQKASPFGTDAGLVAMQMALMAETLGLGTCFCGFLTSALNISPELKKELQIPVEQDVLLSFIIGHPDITFRQVVSRNPARVVYL